MELIKATANLDLGGNFIQPAPADAESSLRADPHVMLTEIGPSCQRRWKRAPTHSPTTASAPFPAGVSEGFTCRP